MKILVIEDDLNTLNGLIDLLHLENHFALGADNAATALQILKENVFDLVLCDFRLPDINGLSLCAQIHQQCRETTLFMFTAYCNLQHREKAKMCGVSRLFNKPLDIDELFTALDSVPARPNQSAYFH
ncbi:MAG: response regulator [Calditrichaeota bacterium]|nr:MAG: response regulator [Calditrichota bacterium]